VSIDKIDAAIGRLAAIEKRIEVAENQISSLVRRFNARDTGEKLAQENTEPLGEDETILFRGKYEGHTHASIVERDPWYIQWLDSNGHARGLGFSAAQIQKALDDPRPEPPKRGR
jgi:broad specificity phosphatase PhoE